MVNSKKILLLATRCLLNYTTRLKNNQIEFSVDVAVEYSELFAQMQEVLEEGGQRQEKNITCRNSEGKCDETFGDEDGDEENALHVPDGA